jgi:hypothetical protein
MQKLVVKGSRLRLYQCRTVITTYCIALYILLLLNTYSIFCIVTTVALPDTIVMVGCTVGVQAATSCICMGCWKVFASLPLDPFLIASIISFFDLCEKSIALGM